eukprot:Colp12_sorted_trinity150504_noHs@6236
MRDFVAASSLPGVPFALRKDFQKNMEKRQDSFAYRAAHEGLGLKQTVPRSLHSNTGLVSSALYNGSTFRGFQKSGRNSYEVEVELKYVDLANSFLCGYLHIKGLTDDYPLLTTFFEAEVVGDKHSFLTRKWEADEAVDRQHWSKFPAFSGLERVFSKDGFKYNFSTSDYVFMRWKEHFLVPDHHVRNIAGASFAGFYYICFQRSTSTIAGFYYHQNSEWFQSLNLKHITERNFAGLQLR